MNSYKLIRANYTILGFFHHSFISGSHTHMKQLHSNFPSNFDKSFDNEKNNYLIKQT